jgi:hypothetical protein
VAAALTAGTASDQNDFVLNASHAQRAFRVPQSRLWP